MRKHIGMVVLASAVVVFLLVYMVAFQVSELRDLVVVTTFGRTERVLSGRDPNAAGLHFKWLPPIQETVRYDARTFLFEDTIEQVYTKDQQNLVLSVFCAWRIEDAAKFLRTIKTVEAAEDAIRKIVRDAKGDAVTTRDLGELINTDPTRMKLEEVEKALTDAVAGKVRDDYGVKVLMVGIKRLGLPADITTAVINSMKAERQSKVQEYRSRGEATATAIRTRAKAASDKIMAFAQRKATEIKGRGEGAAAEYYEKFKGHEDFARFLRALESLEKELAERTVILLDRSALPFVEWFRTPPTPDSLPGATAAQGGR